MANAVVTANPAIDRTNSSGLRPLSAAPHVEHWLAHEHRRNLRFAGRYSGTSGYDWNHPEAGATHPCMLFLRQESESGQFEAAMTECHRYGFETIENMRYGKLVVEVLNTEPYRGFSGFYEEALASGSALVFYPSEAQRGGAA